MKQENCPVCGQLMETFETENRREIHTCEGSQVGRRHLAVVLFYGDPASPPEADTPRAEGESEADPTRIETLPPDIPPLGHVIRQ